MTDYCVSCGRVFRTDPYSGVCPGCDLFPGECRCPPLDPLSRAHDELEHGRAAVVSTVPGSSGVAEASTAAWVVVPEPDPPETQSAYVHDHGWFVDLFLLLLLTLLAAGLVWWGLQ